MSSTRRVVPGFPPPPSSSPSSSPSSASIWLSYSSSSSSFSNPPIPPSIRRSRCERSTSRVRPAPHRATSSRPPMRVIFCPAVPTTTSSPPGGGNARWALFPSPPPCPPSSSTTSHGYRTRSAGEGSTASGPIWVQPRGSSGGMTRRTRVSPSRGPPPGDGGASCCPAPGCCCRPSWSFGPSSDSAGIDMMELGPAGLGCFDYYQVRRGAVDGGASVEPRDGDR
mmetsp:Transcript_18434/g.43696  ORF Transcript_18434/g.43696 Transcript_18434/m.43696 type:complete len:224 (+) Transcript_18434:49-720(+)